MSKISISNRIITPNDVASVAVLNSIVVIDPAIRLKLTSSCKSETEKTNFELPKLEHLTLSEDQILPIKEMRSLMFLRVYFIMQQKTMIRGQVVDFLVALLNAGITPRVASSSTENEYDMSCCGLILAMKGEGSCWYNGNVCKMSTVLTECNVPIIENLSTVEAAQFCQGAITSVAISSLITIGAYGLLNLADATASLSCEAIKVSTAPFNTEHHDLNRPHRGAITTASTLRLMLDNSKLVNTKEGTMEDPSCFRTIPSYHGVARDLLEASLRTVQIEINSGEVGVFQSQPLATTLFNVENCLRILLRGTTERVNVLLNKETTIMKPYLFSELPLFLRLSNLFQELKTSLSIENQTSLSILDQLEKEMLERSQKQPQQQQQQQHQVQEDPKLENISEEKRKQIELKRAKKLALQLEKAKAKANKSGLKLGAGTTEFRKMLCLISDNMTCNLNPFDQTPDSILSKLSVLLQTLGSGGVRRKPKIAKGAQDFLPDDMQLREKIFSKVRSVFKQHGGVEIETPVFELKETLTGKYGEDSKLIYDLADQGGELLALRYDLTVPFARFMAMHNLGNIKRYHIARVYRRDNPQMARGRYREFYQCDFDIAGSYGTMIPDAEVISIGIEILKSFPEIGPFKLKLSHRKLLDAILAIAGVPSEKFRSICSAIDKLDKETWEDVRSEMINDKGLAAEVADRIQPFVILKGSPRELHKNLENKFGSNQDAAAAMKELGLLFDYLDAMGTLDYVSFDLSLARGLDYYTGVIYEAVLTGDVNMGSIGGGGRYDNLVGMFSASGQQIPCVGISIGIERLFSLLQSHAQKTGELRKHTCQVLVAATSPNLLQERIRLCKEIWMGNISAEFNQTENPKFTKQLHYALTAGIPFVVIIGEEELALKVVKIKDMNKKEEATIPRQDLVKELLARGCNTTNILI